VLAESRRDARAPLFRVSAPSTGAFDYLRPGRGQHFVATGRVSRLGDRVAVAHMELVNDTDEQIPTGSAAYIAGLTTGTHRAAP